MAETGLVWQAGPWGLYAVTWSADLVVREDLRKDSPGWICSEGLEDFKWFRP